MDDMREHDWTRQNFFSRDVCRTCHAVRGAIGPCPGSPVRIDGQNNLFVMIESAATDYFDALGYTTFQEASEWYADIEGRSFSLSALALDIARQLETVP